mgnify:CR=1 FL=1
MQVINAAHSPPGIAYDINWNPQSVEEYEHLLLNLHSLQKDANVEDVYECYYMHNTYARVDDLVFRSLTSLEEALPHGAHVGAAAYGLFLDSLDDEQHRGIIAKMEHFIESGKSNYFSRGPE